MPGPLIVLDSSVVVSALIGPEESPSYRLVRAIGTGDVELVISDDFLREISRAVGYSDVEPRIVSPARAFRIALDLGVMSWMHRPPRYEWPSLRDPGDGWMLDLAWETRADCIVTRDPHLLNTPLPFPIETVEPHGLIQALDI